MSLVVAFYQSQLMMSRGLPICIFQLVCVQVNQGHSPEFFVGECGLQKNWVWGRLPTPSHELKVHTKCLKFSKRESFGESCWNWDKMGIGLVQNKVSFYKYMMCVMIFFQLLFLSVLSRRPLFRELRAAIWEGLY